MWKSGASGLLRTNFRNKQISSAGSTHQQAAGVSSQQGGSGRITSAPSARSENSVTGQSSTSTHQRGGQQGEGGSSHRPSERLPLKQGATADSAAPAGFFGLSPDAVGIVAPPQRPNRSEVMSVHDQVITGTALSQFPWGALVVLYSVPFLPEAPVHRSHPFLLDGPAFNV